MRPALRQLIESKEIFYREHILLNGRMGKGFAISTVEAEYSALERKAEEMLYGTASLF